MDIVKKVNLLYWYLASFGWDKIDVTAALVKFKKSQGEKAVDSLIRYIKYSKNKKTPDSSIACTISHDLQGCETECFSPRSSSY